MIDLHAHILPQMDDGAASEKEAQEMTVIAARSGIKCLAATPHCIEGSFEPSPAVVIEGVQKLNAFARAKGLNIVILPGMEVALNPAIPQRLKAGKLLTLGGNSRFLLLEMPVMEVPPYTDELLFKLQIEGIVPVLAHPERCRPLQEDPRWLLEAVKRGALVQITGDSLLGRFGKNVQRLAFALLQAGAVHALGSDAHSSRHRVPDLRQAARLLQEAAGIDAASAILSGRAFAEVLSPVLPAASAGLEEAAPAKQNFFVRNEKKPPDLWSRLQNYLSRRQ